MRIPISKHQYLGFFPPYRTVEGLDHPGQIPSGPLPNRGAALIWNMVAGDRTQAGCAVTDRPPGVALLVLLPPTSRWDPTAASLSLMEDCHPHSVLPSVEEIDTEELVAVLRRFPSELGSEVVDYLQWRGMEVDQDTRRLLRKILDLSGELRTVSGLSRALYMSRRALGRRFMSRGLPVPSHWLHFGRILRAAIRLQDPSANLFTIGCDLGYPDGFALSNQMKRLTGLRPSIMRECFGWEWIVESWLFREAESGSLAPELRARLFRRPGTSPMGRQAAVSGAPIPMQRRSMRVAEESQKGIRAPGRPRHP
jgi:AraC-like DNA-binding protein